MSASDSRPEQEIADLAQQLPAPAERDLTADRHLLLKEHLMAEIQAAYPGFRPVRWPSVRRGTIALAAGLAVLAIVVTASVLGTVVRSVGTGGGSFGPTGGSAGPVALLNKIASAAGRAPALKPGSKKFAYVAIDIAEGKGKLHSLQTWVSVTDLCKGATVKENGVESTIAIDLNKCPWLGTLTYFPTYKLLRSLPKPLSSVYLDLWNAVRKDKHRNLAIITTIGSLLINTITTPRVTAELYEVAATIPGLHVVRHATDPLGRRGFGITYRSNGTRIEWIFNAKTLALAGERMIVAGNSKADRQYVPTARAFTNKNG